MLEARNLSDFNIVKIQASIALVFHPPENLGIRGLFIGQTHLQAKVSVLNPSGGKGRATYHMFLTNFKTILSTCYGLNEDL